MTPDPSAETARDPLATALLLSPEAEAGIRSGWWRNKPNRGALAVGYVDMLLAGLDSAREAAFESGYAEGVKKASLSALAASTAEPPTAPSPAALSAAFPVLTIEGWTIALRELRTNGYDVLRAVLRPPTSETPPASRDYERLNDLRDAIIEAVRTQDGVGGVKAFQAYDDFLHSEATSETPDPLPLDVAMKHRPVLRTVTGNDEPQLECACGWLWTDGDDDEPEGSAFMRHAFSATSETPDPLPLDVELLSEALARTFKVMLADRPNVTAGPPDETVDRAWASVLAGEYALLAAARGPE
jgi:hypothetical protein